MDSCCVIICSCWQFPCHWDWLLQLPLSVSIKIAFFSAVFFFIVVLSDCPASYILLWETCVNWDREGRNVQQTPLQEESKQWPFGSDFQCGAQMPCVCVRGCSEEEEHAINPAAQRFFMARAGSNKNWAYWIRTRALWSGGPSRGSFTFPGVFK